MARAIDGLVSLCSTACAPLGVPVYDGPQMTGDAVLTYVIVGTQDIDADPWVAADGGQEFGAGFGNRSKREEATLYGVVLAWLGDTDGSAGNTVKAARDAAMEAMDAIEQAARLKPALGLEESGMNWGNISTTRLSATSGTRGTVVQISFAVEYRARLEGITS